LVNKKTSVVFFFSSEEKLKETIRDYPYKECQQEKEGKRGRSAYNGETKEWVIVVSIWVNIIRQLY